MIGSEIAPYMDTYGHEHLIQHAGEGDIKSGGPFDGNTRKRSSP